MEDQQSASGDCPVFGHATNEMLHRAVACRGGAIVGGKKTICEAQSVNMFSV